MTETGSGTVDAKQLYYRLIGQLGLESTDSQGNKLRRHPRIRFDSPERIVLVQIDNLSCALFDVSVGGISFVSAHNFNVGHRVELEFEENYTVKASVLRVSAENREDVSTGKEFLHGCQFLGEGDGYRCTVLLLNKLITLMRQ